MAFLNAYNVQLTHDRNNLITNCDFLTSSVRKLSRDIGICRNQPQPNYCFRIITDIAYSDQIFELETNHKRLLNIHSQVAIDSFFLKKSGAKTTCTYCFGKQIWRSVFT